MINRKRWRIIEKGHRGGAGPVVYWMSRDQRALDNPALDMAGCMAAGYKTGLIVMFCLSGGFPGASPLHYRFMIQGLIELEKKLAGIGIPFVLLIGDPAEKIPVFLREISAAALVTDFSPLRIKRRWTEGVRKKSGIYICEVDAHNIVPVWEASEKQEYGARTLRPKIKRRLDIYLNEDAGGYEISSGGAVYANPDWERAEKEFAAVPGGKSVPFDPGETGAMARLEHFLEERLVSYPDERNDPCKNAQSGLSPYLHFGNISARTVARRVIGAGAPESSKEGFLEELIVRKELADNFCFYNRWYDSVKGFPGWAAETLNEHAGDKRDRVYTFKEFEEARTHDDLWNAAQSQMVSEGKMHGYMRMYWGKKILEWSETPAEALETALLLNDRYELDGRDPNGYAGAAWAIGGVHDRAWKERKVFGKVRYMSRAGMDRKFDTGEYIRRYVRRTDPVS